MSCKLPSGLVTERSMSSTKVVVGSRAMTPSVSQVSAVKMLMDVPKSTSVFGKERPCIWTITMGFLGYSYFINVSLPKSKSDKVPTTWIVGEAFIFLTGFFTHSSLIVLA